MIKVKEALQEATKKISESFVSQTPLLDASLLLMQVTNLKRHQLYSASEQKLADNQYKTFNSLVEKRLEGEPIAYLIGSKEFYGHTFKVNNSVLIPRSDSEVIVEKTLEIIKKWEKPKVLDLCTGSGCLGISVAADDKRVEMTLSDISSKALEVAKYNSFAILKREIPVIESNLFSALQKSSFNTIITNPPYLSDAWYDEVELQVKKEPKLALVGGSEDGLDLIRMIIEQSPNYLVDGGALLIECDYRQNDLVASLLKEGGFSAVDQKNDLANVRRIVWGFYYA
jgi:release factor glutamine methyltransferase